MYMRVRAYVCVCARTRVCVWAHTPKRTHALTCVLDEVMTTYAYMPHVSAIELLSIGVDRVWFGSQAFGSATTFNANIGAWNTAAVSNMHSVSAVLDGRSMRHVYVHMYACVRTSHMYPQ
jgi:hypothetical protein